MAHKPGLTKKELEQVLADSTFVADYRFSIHDSGDGECTIYVPFQEKYVRPGGLVCGPVFMAAADMAMWLAIMTKLGRIEIFRLILKHIMILNEVRIISTYL